jgi:tetratricopeptide (TPR) repeat protein
MKYVSIFLSFFLLFTCWIYANTELLKDQCDKGNLPSCNNYGNALEDEGKFAEAREVYQQACQKGKMTACTNFARHLQKEGKNEEAKNLYIKACQGKEQGGCFNYALMAGRYNHPLSEEKQFQAAIEHYRRMCLEKGDYWSCQNMLAVEGNSQNTSDFIEILGANCQHVSWSYCLDYAKFQYQKNQILFISVAISLALVIFYLIFNYCRRNNTLIKKYSPY